MYHGRYRSVPWTVQKCTTDGTKVHVIKENDSVNGLVEQGGNIPGVSPPISAWCPLLATKNTGRSVPG